MGEPHDGQDRGQSEVIGLVLVIGIVLAGTIAIVALGTSVLGDARADAQIDSAEHAMTKLDATVSLVALGTSDTQRAMVSLGGLGEKLNVRPDKGWMNITIVNSTSGNVAIYLMNESLGAIVYEFQRTKIAFQGGGVWKQTPGGATMVSPPEFHYRGTTLTLPLVTVGGGPLNGEDVVIRDATPMEKVFPNSSANLFNPLRHDQINVTVHSEYYEAWGQFFEQRTGGDVSYDHQNETVTVVFIVQSGSISIPGGIVSGAAGSELLVENNIDVDSYNSSQGDYEATAAQNTDVIVAGDATIENKGKLSGDLIAGGTVDIVNNGEVTGNVSYGEDEDLTGNVENIQGWTNNNATVPSLRPVRALIDAKTDQFSSSNDNGVTAIDGTTLAPGSTWELPPGEYYLSEIELESGDELILNATGGNISIVVQKDIVFDGNSLMRVKGNGTVRFFNQGSLTIHKNSNVSVVKDRAPQLWMFFKPSQTVEFKNNVRFVGVIYGAARGGDPGVDIQLGNNIEIYGGIVGDVPNVPNGLEIHYDEALAKAQPLAGTDQIPLITYMHVTVNSVNATSR